MKKNRCNRDRSTHTQLEVNSTTPHQQPLCRHRTDSVGPDGSANFHFSSAASRHMCSSRIGAAVKELQEERRHHACSRFIAPPSQEMEQPAIAEAKNTVGDLFRCYRGRGAPEGSLCTSRYRDLRVWTNQIKRDSDLMSVLELPDDMAEALVGCDEVNDPTAVVARRAQGAVYQHGCSA